MSMQNNKTEEVQKQPVSGWLMMGLLLISLQVTSVFAASPTITELNFSSLSGNQVQIQLGMDGPAMAPKVFQTDNPARIALDFSGVTSGLKKKKFSVNQGAANTEFVVEAEGRTRVVINLLESVSYETKIIDNNVFVVLKAVKSLVSSQSTIVQEKQVDQRITNLLPEQTIKNIDFRRGGKGEGRILIELSAPNTVVNLNERGGRVVLNFLNTKLPESLVKSFDVSDFATPVKKIDARRKGAGVNINITPVNGNYDYTSYQSDGLLTIDFLPLSKAEKEAKLKEKFPYIGKKLTLNFQDIEVRSVLQILADFTELNIIAADTVGGTVTLRLNDVPWDQALDLILKSKGLAKRQTGNVVLVAPAAEIIKIEEEELAAKKVVEQLEPLRTEYIEINYAKAEEIQLLLTGQNVSRSSGSNSSSTGNSSNTSQSSNRNRERDGLLSDRGRSTVDSRTNTLIVRDTAEQLEEIRELIKILDVPIRQVMIETRIVVAGSDFLQNLGVKFGVAKDADDIGGGQSFTGGIGGPGEATSILTDVADALAASAGGGLGLTLARGADYVLNLEIKALQEDGDTELLSNPRIMTTDRVQATIKQGVQIPYQTQSQDGPVTELVDAVLELDVTPQITPSGTVMMDLKIKKDSPGAPVPSGTGLAIPINNREISTSVQVNDGETVVLGGIFEGESQVVVSSVPWLSDLPGVGWLFKTTTTKNDKRELLIFVTPKIVKNTLSAR